MKTFEPPFAAGIQHPRADTLPGPVHSSAAPAALPAFNPGGSSAGRGVGRRDEKNTLSRIIQLKRLSSQGRLLPIEN
jgi:hypothetical protein